MPSPNPHRRPLRRLAAAFAGAVLTTGLLTGCSTSTSDDQADSAAVEATATADSVWDASVVHVVSIELDEDEYAAMVATYQETGDKEWLTADVTIDGQTFSDVGLRLKGNSSLMEIDADSEAVDMPWLIDLDHFVDGQSLDGSERFVVRSNNTETSLNEAVALDLLEEAGLASEEAVASRFSVNGSDSSLRLVVQDLDESWDQSTFGTEGILYKSESGGDWSYRGDEAAAYDEVFDVEAGEEDLAPLTEFLQWLEESSDEEFSEGLADRLDVEEFATYLAFEDLIGNFDDIDGPGNNSYLRWDAESGQFTVVAWDHNLAFGGSSGEDGQGGGGTEEGGEPGEGMPSGEPPEGFDVPEGEQGEAPPEGFEMPQGDGAGEVGGSNVLAERFMDDPEFEALYDEAAERLQAELFDDGTAQEILDTWTALLTESADDLVDTATITEEADQVESYFDGHGIEDSEETTGTRESGDDS